MSIAIQQSRDERRPMGAIANDALLEGTCDNGTPLAAVDNVTCHKQLMKGHADAHLEI